MTKLKSLFIIVLLLQFVACSNKNANQHEEATNNETEVTSSMIYELRTYHAAEGKLDALLSRFRDHTTALFDKHGMQNVGYWVPIENEENLLIYLLGFPSKEHRESSWKAFREDPDWINAKEESEVDGKLVNSVDNVFLTTTNFSPPLVIDDQSPRVFELRMYYTNEDQLVNLHSRFRDHTMEIFESNGMSNIVYFDLIDDQSGAKNTLIYLISHKDKETADLNWENFINDPDWITAYEKSIENGALVDSLTSVFMIPTDFSALK